METSSLWDEINEIRAELTRLWDRLRLTQDEVADLVLRLEQVGTRIENIERSHQ